MAKFHPPENFDFMRPAGWPEWRERFDRYRKASKLHKEDEDLDVQVSTLIYALGKEADKIFKTFTFTNAADANKYEPHAKQSQCPARGKTCRKCNKQNHFARVCRSGKNINEVETFFTEAVTEENEEVFFMGSVFDINSVRQEAEPPWFVDINLCGLSTIFKIDTGADVSVVSRNIYQKLCPKPKLTRSNAILRGPGGLIHHEGEFQACFSHRSTSVNARCFVIDSSENLLSRDIPRKLQLVQRINNNRKPLHPGPDPLFSDPVKCAPVHITITENAKPFSIATARRVPFPTSTRSKLNWTGLKRQTSYTQLKSLLTGVRQLYLC
ncbi:hypothetical protein RRG08_019678 [Elysia crispata]|uniref:Peptidase A2 domain-containing protein n=1 Tax=Elysia crispata TaxID=231223 RepID=A0AAE1D649_9GAST|nr:hypothetical protein RRG08_019678 [Elysia crispata]